MRSQEPSPTAIVTPEAVLLEFELAAPASRALALAVDLAIQFVALGVLLTPVSFLGLAVGETAVGVILAILTPLVLFTYAPLCEVLYGGRTVGKMALGLRVVTVDGAPVGARQAAIRGVFVFVDLWLPPGGSTGLVSMLVGRRSQRVGDRVAGTLVMRERSSFGSPLPMTISAPPGWEPYAAALDVTLLRSDQAALVRQLLLRVPELGEEARWETTRRLANHVANQIRHQPPPYLGAEAFLVAVMAAVQRRSAALGGPPPAVPPTPGGPAWSGARPPAGPPPPQDRVAAPAWSSGR